MYRIKLSICLLLVLVLCAVPIYAQDEPTVARAVVNQPEVQGTAIDPSIMDYGAVRDVYGGRIAARYLAVQLNVENYDERPYWLRGVTFGFDLSQCDLAKSMNQAFDLKRCHDTYNRMIRYPYAAAPTDQRVLIAVSRVGTAESMRTRLFGLLEFATGVAPIFAPYLNVTQSATIAGMAGVGIPALARMFPDKSPKQLEQLVDHSYRQGIIVGPKSSETFVIFIPSDAVFDSTTWSNYTASAQKQSPTALETKQFMRMVAIVSIRGAWITTEPAAEVRSNSLLRTLGP
jgi:hypothetical protein